MRPWPIADLVAFFCGARGQGKSTLARALIAAQSPRRLLVFDPMNEYGDAAERVERLAAIHARVGEGGEFRLRYVPPTGTREQTEARFNALCAIAYDAGDLLLVVEELQLVTRPSWAPDAWAECTLRGRHRKLSIVGVSQRPASVDKNFLSNCSTVATCRLNFEDDVQCLARLLGVERERVAGLKTYAYIARDMNTGAVREGVTPAPQASPVAPLKAPKPARPGRARKKK